MGNIRKGYFAKPDSNWGNGEQVGRLTLPVQIWVWTHYGRRGSIAACGEVSWSAM